MLNYLRDGLENNHFILRSYTDCYISIYISSFNSKYFKQLKNDLASNNIHYEVDFINSSKKIIWIENPNS